MSDTTDPLKLEHVRLALIHASENRNLGEPLAIDQLWTEFFQQYNPMLVRFAHRAQCPQGSIDEVVCRVWDDVLTYLPRFEYQPTRGRFRSWLFKIVKNKAIDAARSLGRRQEINVDLQSTVIWHQIVDPRSVSDDDPLTRLYHQEVCFIIMEKFVADAAAMEQEVVKRCVMAGQDAKTVAAELGLSVDNVRQLKHRGIVRLKIIAAEQFGPDPLN